MRRTLLMLCLAAALVMLLAPVAFAQGSQGANSQVRNDAAVFGGPHCHTNVVASASTGDDIWVFPSHNAHLKTLGNDLSIFGGAACELTQP